MATQIIILDESLGRELIKMRKNMGWTQEQLAEKAGMNPMTISRIENEQSIPENITIEKIMACFGKKYKIKYALLDSDKDLTTEIVKKKKRF